MNGGLKYMDEGFERKLESLVDIKGDYSIM